MDIKEVIVVEGKDDEAAIKQSVNAEVIITRGFGITDKIVERIRFAQQRKGVIIFTDPDYAGERIREYVNKNVPNCKHAFLPKHQAMKGDNIGIENATPESIRCALSKVKTMTTSTSKEFTKADLVVNKLSGNDGATHRRDKLGNYLGIGYCNAKQFLNRLNNYGIERHEFNDGLIEINKEEQE